MLCDRYGNPVSTRSEAALARYDAALEQIRLYQGDPVATLDEALAADPAFGSAWAARAGLLVTASDKAYLGEAARSVESAARSSLTDRDREHLAAASDIAQGRFMDGTARYARLSRAHPRDLLAIQYAHVGCFFLGLQSELRDVPLAAMRAFADGDDGQGALLGMAAFGLEECGDLERAEELGRRGVEIDPRDGWAVHAVAHVYEMRGDLDRGIPWLEEGAGHWAPGSGFAYHNWWHLALLYLDRGDTRQALKLYDEQVRPAPEAQVLLEWIDASAMLWRLRLEGVDVGERFAPLAACWERARDDAFYAFNDVHAVLAFLGAGRMADAERILAALRRAALEDSDNGEMTRRVGLPVAAACIALEQGDAAQCLHGLLAVRPLAQRFGGSHAQRDLLSLTALHAAMRSGSGAIAEALAAERLAHKPHSPWARRLARQVAGGATKAARAA
jgi:tetratricopeptide (TPR) repeat protein